MSEERVHELLYSCDSRTELCEMIAKLEDENAKLCKQVELLQKLSGDLYEMAWPEYPSAFEKAFVDRMHRLGVEV